MSLRISLLYALFAGVATLVNIASQYVVDLIYPNLAVSLCVGTLIGLYAKYYLDKKYIFKYQTQSTNDNGKTFLLYSFMGVFTTLIYLAFELGFDYIFSSLWMRYMGGAIGLILGYTIKYQLDKRFVFK